MSGWKVYMPNIVMVDFANNDKCCRIAELNDVAATQITGAFQALEQEVAQKEQRLVGQPSARWRCR